MNGTNYKIKCRYVDEQEWHDGFFIYDTEPLVEIQKIAQEMVNESKLGIAETMVVAIHSGFPSIEVSRHTREKI